MFFTTDAFSFIPLKAAVGATKEPKDLIFYLPTCWESRADS